MNNKVVRGTCIDISFEGKGVLKSSEGIVFVDGLFVGEEAEVEILYKRAGSYFGKVTHLIKKSDERIQPVCGVCTACGGCQFQQLSYSAQLKYKTNKVKNALKRHLNKDIDVMDCIGMVNPYNYRNKVQVPFARDIHGHIVSGFYRSNTHKIIPIDSCAIEDNRASKIIQSIKKLMKEFHLEPYDEDKQTGLIRHVLIRTSYHYNEIMVTLVTAIDEFKGKNNFVKSLVNQNDNIVSVVQNINSRHTNVILGEKERILYGKPYIKDDILGVTFHISSKSFFQVNPVQVEILYSKAIEFADLKKSDKVFDAYCGIGTIGLIASKYSKEVIGVEIVKAAIINANNNVKLNKIENAKFICDDAGNLLERYADNNVKFDCVFVDPPRKGLDDRFINSLLRVLPKRIVYVSCEPETLARDLKILSKNFDIQKVQPVDMFPMTFHVETVVSLIYK